MLQSYEALNNLREVEHEIRRLNETAGYTVFNPAALDALREVMKAIEEENLL